MDAKASVLNECMLKIMRMFLKKSKCTCQCRDFVFLKSRVFFPRVDRDT